MAACLGPRVPLRSLSAASELPTPQLVEALGAASRAGLVLLEGAGWKLLRTADPLESPPLDDAVLRFVHDAVQTAAYERTPESERPDLHLRVARLLVPQLLVLSSEQAQQRRPHRPSCGWRASSRADRGRGPQVPDPRRFPDVGVHPTPAPPNCHYIWGVFTPKTARARAPAQILRQFFRPIGEGIGAVLTW